MNEIEKKIIYKDKDKFINETIKKYGNIVEKKPRTNIIHNILFYQNGSKKFINKNLERILTEESKYQKYIPSLSFGKANIHWGQRKLLLSEIEFLTKFIPKYPNIDLIIYVGAANGLHIPFLSELFPKFSFILIDPAEFCENVYNMKNTEVIQKFMNINQAKEFRKKYKKKYFFISDIRVSVEEEEIMKDMKDQETWIKIMKPKASIIKFRLPWDNNPEKPNEDKIFEYIDGDIYFPVWGCKATTECRLMIEIPEKQKIKTKFYNYEKYEGQCNYFKIYTRQQYYPYSIINEKLKNLKSLGLCHCYDCVSEVKILYDCLNFMNILSSSRNIETLIKDISNSISFKPTNLWSYYVFNRKEIYCYIMYNYEEHLEKLSKILDEKTKRICGIF